MKCIETVTGPVQPEELGWCQMHEHIVVHHTPMADKNPALLFDNEQKSLAELRSYYAAGGCAITDAQPVGAGRDAAMLTRLAKESGVRIIASTGYHLEGFYPENSPLRTMDKKALYDLYCSELTIGMLADGELSNARRLTSCAGIVKAAIPEEGPTGRYATLLSAAARAAAVCDVPLMLHTEKGSHAGDAVRLCCSEGLTPHRILVCHADRQASDFMPHDEIAEMGVYLEYDTIGRFKYHSDEDEVRLIKHIIDSGYEKKLLLSLDTTAERLGAYGGGISLNYLIKTFVPLLESAGVSKETIQTIFVRNPQKVFCG